MLTSKSPGLRSQMVICGIEFCKARYGSLGTPGSKAPTGDPTDRKADPVQCTERETEAGGQKEIQVSRSLAERRDLVSCLLQMLNLLVQFVSSLLGFFPGFHGNWYPDPWEESGTLWVLLRFSSVVFFSKAF